MLYFLLPTHFLFTILTCAHRMRVHFCPQHYLASVPFGFVLVRVRVHLQDDHGFASVLQLAGRLHYSSSCLLCPGLSGATRSYSPFTCEARKGYPCLKGVRSGERQVNAPFFQIFLPSEGLRQNREKWQLNG